MTIYEEPVQMAFPGLAKMLDERKEQVTEKGYTLIHDQEHGPDLLRAAACYIDWAASMEEGTNDPNDTGPHPFWPWDDEAWNPGSPVAAMLKGGAMVAAYYDAQYGGRGE